MSRLSLYAPDVDTSADEEYFDSEDAAIVPFPSIMQRFAEALQHDPVTRARTVYNNRVCPDCGHCSVEPIALCNVFPSRDRAVTPATDLLIGFRCHDCHSQWSPLNR